MSNLAKLDLVALDISGKNFLTWVVDAQTHLDANGLGDSIKEGNKVYTQDKAKAMIFLHRHLHEGLKIEYLIVKDPLDLWKNLAERYERQKEIILPQARYQWIHMRLQDFKSVSDYNSAVFRINSQLKLCGDKITDHYLLEKTFSTFRPSNVLLQQQYREKGFKKYHELISCLLVAEQNNELLLKNHETLPTGSALFPEANVTTYNEKGRASNRDYGRGRGRGRGRGHGHGCQDVHFENKSTHQKWAHKEEIYDKGKSGKYRKTVENLCHPCGGKGHWARTCCTPKHLVDLYQQSIKGKRAETNYVHENEQVQTNLSYDDCDTDGPVDITHLDISDFYSHPEGKIDHLIGGGVLD